MNSVVIVNLQEYDADLVKRLKYNLEKAGFSLSESYTSGAMDNPSSKTVAETLILVYNKAHEKT